MGKRRFRDSDAEKLEHLKRENAHIKRELSRVKKELARLDIDKYAELEEITDYQERKEAEKELKRKKEEEYKEKWQCKVCGRDYLRLCVYNRIDGTYYNRKCPTCLHKTKLQKYTPEVEKKENV